jgi:hypothetical protein
LQEAKEELETVTIDEVEVARIAPPGPADRHPSK